MHKFLFIKILLAAGILSLVFSSIANAGKASEAIKSWKDLRNAIPAAETVVYVAPPNDFYLVYDSNLHKDKTSLTGWAVSLGETRSWAMQYQFPSYSALAWDCTESQEFLKKDTKHTVYVLLKKLAQNGDKFQLDWGLYPDPNPALFGVPETAFDCKHLRTGEWTLLRLGEFYPNQSPLFFNSSAVHIGAIVITSNYKAVTRIGRYITPNGDGLNDVSNIRAVVNPGQKVSISITDSAGNIILPLIKEQVYKSMLVDAAWNGKVGKDVAQPGYYGVRVTVDGEVTDYPETILLEKTPKLKPASGPDYSNFFPMGFFMDASNGGFIPNDPVESVKWYEKHFSRLQEYGFNNLWIVWWKPGHDKPILETAQKYGIKIAMNQFFRWAGGDPKTPQILTETYAKPFVVEMQQKYKDYPAFMGPIIYDEPTHNVLDRWTTMQRTIYNVDPNMLAATVFNDFNCARKASQMTPLQALCTDIYFIMNVGDIRTSLKGYFEEVKSVVKVAGNRPAWIMPQVYQPKSGIHRMPTVPEVRAECWLALAGGGKGIITFLYQDFENGDLQGAIDGNGNPKDTFFELSRFSKTIDPFKKLIIEFQPAKIGAKAGDDFLLGEFKDKSGKNYIVLASINTTETTLAKIKLPEAYKQYKATDLIAGRELTNNGTITCGLAPGGGTIIKLEAD